ncbi:MAG TPA: selenide, water dikinase SelD, partial [Thermodesulfobacteriota bacterium]|nr:selenide, water dikinase SelD [Thermodesulfobacteriota bacterium]
PEDLDKALRPLPREMNPNVLVGKENFDEAGVYRMSDDTALVQTLDFITPIVDDPFLFGQIAAANSLSDVYAMGGRPITVMNIMGFPRATLDISVLTEILRGGMEKVHEAGAAVMGGHTVDDPELKYGLSVTGIVHPEKIRTNAAAREGDVLILTKRLGTGIISTAIKAEMADDAAFQTAVESMTRLNRAAAEAMEEYPVHACTDITGFGFLGHAAGMARASGVSLRLAYSKIPVMGAAKTYAAQGLVPAGAYCNQGFWANHVSISEKVPELERIVLFDPQTSGGLLISLPRPEGEELLKKLQEKGIKEASLVGEVIAKEKNLIVVEA